MALERTVRLLRVPRVLLLLVLLGLFAGVGVGVQATIIEPRRLDVHRVELRIDPWSPALDGLRVALVSDLHAGSPWVDEKRIDAVVRSIEQTAPDLIVLAGDYTINGVALGRFLPPGQVARHLAGLHAPLGVYAVLGNHDWWNGAEAMISGLEADGITVLDNQAMAVPDPTGRRTGLWISGIADPASGHSSWRHALADVPPGAPLIAVSHQPDVFAELPGGVSLTLAGHTHGGQIAPFGCTIATASRYGNRYVRGHVAEDGKDLFVTSGIGTSILPARLGVPPEIVLLTLHPT